MKITKDFWLVISVATLFLASHLPADSFGKGMIVVGFTVLVLTLLAYIY